MMDDLIKLFENFPRELMSDRDLENLNFRSIASLRNDRWKGKPLIPHFKVGKNVRYWKKDVISFLKENRVEPR